MVPALALAAALLAPPGGGPPKADSYLFELDEKRVVGFFRKNLLVVGTFDKDGEFHRIVAVEAKPLADGLSGIRYSGPKYELICVDYQMEKCSVYELRSGRLIPGMYSPEGLFVPELGGKITDFKEYKYSDKAVPIWNLPGKFVPEGEGKKEQTKPEVKSKEPR